MYKVQEEIKEDEEKPSQLSLVKPSTPNKQSSGKKESKLKGGKGKHEEHEVSSGERETSSDSETDEKSDDHESKKKRKQKKQEDDDMRAHAREAHKDGNSRTEHISQHLEKVAFKEKVKLGVYVFVVLIFLNSCLIACFSIGQKTFKDDSNAVFSLATFYHRQNCLENLLLYSYE